MKLQFFSDVHLEFGELNLERRDSDVIIAAGDIGLGLAGMDWLQEADRPVIYVAGNHEYYSREYQSTLAALRAVGRGEPVHFLENKSIEIDGVRFLGATLWTNLKSGDPELVLVAQNAMNDYNQIGYGRTLLRPEHTLAIHERSCQWLLNELKRPYPGKTVVVTHHAPSYRSWAGDGNSIFRHTYCNNLDTLMVEYDIAIWIHGHVHTITDYYCHETRVVCNARGYTGHQPVNGFELTRMVEI
jgi:predicted phosphodiesterase